MDGHVSRSPRKLPRAQKCGSCLTAFASALLHPSTAFRSNVVKPYINPLLEKFGKGEGDSK
jgi:hypothetical protein